VYTTKNENAQTPCLLGLQHRGDGDANIVSNIVFTQVNIDSPTDDPKPSLTAAKKIRRFGFGRNRVKSADSVADSESRTTLPEWSNGHYIVLFH